MYIVFLNPQGNFDNADSYWTMHPDFGGQLVYVKELAIALAKLGNEVDIITRQMSDNSFPEFQGKFDRYPSVENVKIIRIPCGNKNFLRKEELWPYLHEWTNNIQKFFAEQNKYPAFMTGHYGDGGISALMLSAKLKIPFSFTGHSLGAQKIDKLIQKNNDLHALDNEYHFRERILAEKSVIQNANIIFVSTIQEQLEQYSHPLYKKESKENQHSFSIAAPGANTDIFTTEPKKYDRDHNLKFKRIMERDLSQSRLDLPLIVLASRLDEKKNHLGVVEAYASDVLLQKRFNLAISLRGIENAFMSIENASSDEKVILKQILEVIDQYRLNGKITLISIDSQTELASFYRFAAKKKSLFVLASLYEPFGLAPIEAMSSGLVAVVTANGGPKSVLLDENNIHYGELIDPFDLKSIVDGLHNALDNHALYQVLGRKRVEDNYTWNATAKRYIEAISRAIKTYKRIELSIPKYLTDPDLYPIDFIILNMNN